LEAGLQVQSTKDRLPEARVQIAIMSGVLAPRFLHHPLARLPKSVKCRRTVAALLQMLQPLAFPWSIRMVPRLPFGRLVTFADLTREAGMPGKKPLPTGTKLCYAVDDDLR
jgi:hypothetical protein